MALVSVHQLSKSYGGVDALQQVDLKIKSGEIHALCGENGAGKSTLIKILGGAVVPNAGEIELDHQVLPFGNVRVAEARGIVVIHQEAIAFPHLNAVDNIFVGRELTRWSGLRLDRAQMRAQTEQLVERLGEQIDLALPLGQLPLAQRQMVAIARALSHDCRLLIMDEPTASLSKKETDILFKVIRQLKDRGVSVLYVSHRLEEVFELSDRVTVLRDGRWVATHHADELDRDGLIRLLVGRELPSPEAEVQAEPGTACPPTKVDGPRGDRLPSIPNEGRELQLAENRKRVVLKVIGLSQSPQFQNVSFEVHGGEIVGVAGLVGAGRSEMARAVFGIDPFDDGEVVVDGVRLPGGSVSAAMRQGVALVPEDRQQEGLILPLSVRGNLTLPFLRRLSRRGVVVRDLENEYVSAAFKDFTIKAESWEIAAESLSGGNQQKVVLAKWLQQNAEVLIFDEPTRGIDVGAKHEIYQLMNNLTAQGKSIIMISSELPEVLGMSDRILVMHEGRITGEIGDVASTTQEKIMELAINR